MPDSANGKQVIDAGMVVLREQGPDAFQLWLKTLSKDQSDDVAAYMGTLANVISGFVRQWQYTRADIVLYLLGATIPCPFCHYPNLVNGLYEHHVCHMCTQPFEGAFDI